MNFGFQRFNISRSLSGRGIETEKFDIDAHIDRRLSFGENVRNIERMHGLNVGSATRAAWDRANRPTRRERARDTRGEFYQTGRSHQVIDERRSARDPGFRRTKWGTSYTERRRNRSDRPGRRV